MPSSPPAILNGARLRRSLRRAAGRTRRFLARPLGPIPRLLRQRRRARADARLVRDLVGGLRYAYVFRGCAVLVTGWQTAAHTAERGARVEVRLLTHTRHRGTTAAAQRLVIDDAVFRADLFDRADAPARNMQAAHFHGTFFGCEPGRREEDAGLRADPLGWLGAQLADLPTLLARSNVVPADSPWIEADAEALRSVLPAILEAVETTLEAVRAAVAAGPADPVAAAGEPPVAFG